MQTADHEPVTLARFSEIARDESQALARRYGLEFCVSEHIKPRDPEASAFVVRFRNSLAGVILSYLTSGSDVNVILCELVDGAIPSATMSIYGDPGHPRAVLLDALIHYTTNGTVSPPLPMITADLALEEMFRRHDEREQLIRTGLRHVVRAYAECTDKYGTDILQGDFSVVPEVQRFTRKLYYPSPEQSAVEDGPGNAAT
jgi:hypothetical protein